MDPQKLIKGETYEIHIISGKQDGEYIGQTINHRQFKVKGEVRNYAESFVKQRVEPTSK